MILGSLLDVLPSGDQRWVDVLDAMPPDAEWAASYNRIAFDIGPGVAAFSEIERVLLEQQRVMDATVDPRAQRRLALVSSTRRAPGVVPRQGRRRRARAERAADLYERAVIMPERARPAATWRGSRVWPDDTKLKRC